MSDESIPVTATKDESPKGTGIEAPTPPRHKRSMSLLFNGVFLGASLFGVGLIYYSAVGYWYRLTSPPPPIVTLDGMDPQVVKAITIARSAVLKSPGNADRWGFLGKALRAHEFEEASNVCFRQAEKLDPTDPRWPYLLARGLRATDPVESVRNGGPCRRSTQP